RGRGRGRGGRGRGGGRGHSSSSADYSQSSGGGERRTPSSAFKGQGNWIMVCFKTDTFCETETRPTIELSLSKQAKITGLLDQLERHSKAKVLDENSDFMKRYRQNVEKQCKCCCRSDHPQLGGYRGFAKGSGGRLSLKDELDRKQANSKYQNMLRFREKLPAYQHRNEFLKLLAENQVIVISGETGCGKTTQCCQLILDEMIQAGNGSLCNIVCTQPRRISAISVAERVAEERDERIGQNSVGYSIRLESRLPQRTRGSILFYLKDDPKLTRFSHVVVDEIHERDVLSDFLMTILKDLINIRPDLKVILMSATINADQFSRHCPCFNIPGFTFPVKEYYLEDVLAQTRFTFETKDDQQQQQPWRGRGRKEHMKDEEK
ncbi:ATP-dependent RNA helicase DHX36, partial [Orchesella cincta]